MNASAEMPRYKCHKEVWALKIKSVDDSGENCPRPDFEATIYPEDERYAPFKVSRDYMTKHKPKAGGYYVVYRDGYRSYSPAKEFEDGYTLIKP